MDVDKISKRAKESFDPIINDIFGRRIYSGDCVYFSEGGFIKVGIVEKLTKTGCKLYDCGCKVFSSRSLCIINGNEDASKDICEKLSSTLANALEEKAANKKFKEKFVVFIGKIQDEAYFGQLPLRYSTKKERSKQIEEFKTSSGISKLQFLCKNENEVFFTDDYSNSNILEPSFKNNIFRKWKFEDGLIKIQYKMLNGNEKDEALESIKERMKHNGSFSYAAKPTTTEIDNGFFFFSSEGNLLLPDSTTYSYCYNFFINLAKRIFNIDNSKSYNYFRLPTFYWYDSNKLDVIANGIENLHKLIRESLKDLLKS